MANAFEGLLFCSDVFHGRSAHLEAVDTVVQGV
jgi:hypothetical protein